MSDSGPTYVVDTRIPEDERDAVKLVVEYHNADDLIRDYNADLSSGRTFVPTQRELIAGTEVTVVLSFPGLLQPLRIAGIVKSNHGEAAAERGASIEFLDFDAETKGFLDDHIAKIKDRDPEVVVSAVRVLVVEDNPHCAKLIQEGLRLAGRRAFDNKVAFDVPVASNAADAFTFLHSRPIDVLITDIYLGGVSGTTVIEHVRSDTALRGIPVIAISAGDEATRKAALQAGADVFLPKPVRLRQIVSTVGKVLTLEQLAWR